jgi:hypothetical protein
VIVMKRTVSFATLVLLLLFAASAVALAHGKQPQSTQGILYATTPSTTSAGAPTPTRPAKTEGKAESKLKHKIVTGLGYSLFVLIILSVASGFFKRKKKYRRIHHAFAFTLLVVAILHGILALTL